MKYHVGCAIVNGHRIIGRGWNAHLIDNFRADIGAKWLCDRDMQCAYHAEMFAIMDILRKYRLLQRAWRILRYLQSVNFSTSDANKLARKRCVRAEVSLYVARTKMGECKCAKPCDECLRWMNVCAYLGIRIKKIVHTVDSEIGARQWNTYNGSPHKYHRADYLW